MKREEFYAYCEKIALMQSNCPNWYLLPDSIVSDYLRSDARYGFGQVLTKLLKPSYELISAQKSKFNNADGEKELDELASVLSVRYKIDGYRYLAYYFAICFTAVVFYNLPITAIELDAFDQNELFSFDASFAVMGESDPQKRQLKKLSIRLLDFSRNNQLVNFRNIKKSTLSLFAKDNYKVLSKIAKGDGKFYLASWKKLSPYVVYQCKICQKIEVRKFDFSAKKQQPALACSECDKENNHGRKSMVAIPEQLSFEFLNGYICECENNLTVDELLKNNLTCPSCGKVACVKSFPIIDKNSLKVYQDNEFISSVSDNQAKETARLLMNKEKNTERNFGLHVLYLAFGFLKWKDQNNTEFNSPLLLCPINLAIDKKLGQYYFEVPQDMGGFEVNKTLIHMLNSYSKSLSITLPNLEFNVGAYFSLVRESFKNSSSEIYDITKSWEIDESFKIGLFQYQKLQLHHDIEENADKYLVHPVIRRLCGDFDAEIESGIQRERYCRDYAFMDADSSQEEVIKRAQEGESFILQGPPGSGKSQTITNIISSLLGEGKTVLFVTEKASARSVIMDNLRAFSGGGINFSDFVLDFSAFKKRSGAIGRDPFVNELNRNLTPYVSYDGYDDWILADEKSRYEKVQKVLSEMRDDFGGRNFLRLLKDMAKYSRFKELSEKDCLPKDFVEFVKVLDTVEKYYSLSKNLNIDLDYTKDSLYKTIGDFGGDFYKTSVSLVKVLYEILAVKDNLKNYGILSGESEKRLSNCAIALRLWKDFPSFDKKVLEKIADKKAQEVIDRALKRAEFLKKFNSHHGVKFYDLFDKDKCLALDLNSLSARLFEYKPFIKRIGKKYRETLSEIFGALKTLPQKRNYKTAVKVLENLYALKEYLLLEKENGQEKFKDESVFGFVPTNESDFLDLVNDINSSLTVISQAKLKFVNAQKEKEWILRFDNLQEGRVKEEISENIEKLEKAVDMEISLKNTFLSYFDGIKNKDLAVRDTLFLAEKIVSQKDRLANWRKLYLAIEEIKNNGLKPLLDELISSKETDVEVAKNRLYKTFYAKLVTDFIQENNFQFICDFDRDSYAQLINGYSESDKRVLSTSAKRLYEKLKKYLDDVAKSKKAKSTNGYPKLQSKPHYSIKRTIKENWEYVKRIKPCFMMSPLNVSQYVDIDVKFDLVIFDEASQIFTEDALTAISRGKQVIICGDSKQLPPCDFFRAGDVSLDDDEQYYDDEQSKDCSLLVSASNALNDKSIGLNWHYRSCDESLIAFSNEHMDYNLITFPSAVKNINDGIRFVEVPYAPSTCYEAGKNGAHINSGEADKIVNLIYEEMIHPERKFYSIGVVAFSNAQAFEIENRWEIFKQNPDVKDDIEAWEKLHDNEPLIFCNLDTVQGDERDTTILSICYSPDFSGRFALNYLGRIRLLSGKKRINVAITRAKHQMIVVSTLDISLLKATILSSSACEDNKAGAEMLCKFLEYAKSLSNKREMVFAKSNDPFVSSVCEVLDELGVLYETEIGRSDCKINIGVRDGKTLNNFALGIIIDNPSRPDFDSVREYTRLTNQILSEKYGWKLYRIFPACWAFDYEREKKLLIDAIKSAT